MANSEYKVPPFIKRDGESLVYNDDGYLYFFIPEEYFTAKCADEYGSFYIVIGMFNYARESANHKPIGKVKPFNFPTKFMCKPSNAYKKKSGSELNTVYPGMAFEDNVDYRVLEFKKGDHVVESVYIPELVENTEDFFRLLFIVARLSNTIPYDKFQDYIKDNINLTGNDYGINAQMYGIIISEIVRDKDNLKIPFRCGKNIDKDMRSYKLISMRNTPNYIDPYVSITSQYWDESLMSAVLLDENKGSPLEKVMMN